MKNVVLRILFLIPLFSLISCVAVPYDNVQSDEDILVGSAWQWTKTVYQEEGYYAREYVDYAHEEVLYRFYYDGDISMKSTSLSHFGHLYTDWVDGHWDYRGGELRISTYDGVWYYDVVRLDHWSMILSYCDEVIDDWGRRVRRRVYEYYER